MLHLNVEASILNERNGLENKEYSKYIVWVGNLQSGQEQIGNENSHGTAKK